MTASEQEDAGTSAQRIAEGTARRMLEDDAASTSLGMTLEEVATFKASKGCITQAALSHDSGFLATADLHVLWPSAAREGRRESGFLRRSLQKLSSGGRCLTPRKRRF